VFGDGTDADVVAFADDPLEAAVQVFHVRGGRVRGERGWVVEKTEDLTVGDLVHHFCTQVYGAEHGETDVPRELLVPELPPDVDALAEWLSQHRGSRVHIRVPQRGDKRALMETVERNAGQALAQHKLKRASDLTARGRALEEIAEALGMEQAPLRIECFDVSQIQGTDVVASMVVFEDGLARRGEYRRFIVKGDTDDLAAMSEVLRRRFARYLDAISESGDVVGSDPADAPDNEAADVEAADVEAADVETADVETADEAAEVGTVPDPTATPGMLVARSRKFAYPPQLVVVDGGAPQVQVAAQVLADLGIDDITVCGLAKRLEEVWLPNEEYPVILPRTSEALYLLQRVRDEAHRFAITFHRQRRSKRMTTSLLDGIPGLGEVRRKALLTRFGSLKRLAAASAEEIASVPGIGDRTAAAIVAALAAHGASSGGAPRGRDSSGGASPGDASAGADPPDALPDDGSRSADANGSSNASRSSTGTAPDGSDHASAGQA
jgi:excinuclease ABC subunit C